MQAFQGYFKNGHIIPIRIPRIPEGRKIIITVLDEPAFITKEKKQLNIDEITLASERSLSKDWLLPEDDLVWADL